MHKVDEIMKQDFLWVVPNTSVTEVAQKMRDSKTGTAIVTENGKLRGVVTENSIISKIVASGLNPSDEHASSIMCNNLPKICPGTDITEAAKCMVNHSVQSLPVVQNGRLLGLITVDDLVEESPALAFMVFSKRNKSKVNGHNTS